MNERQRGDYLYKADRLFGQMGLWLYGHKAVIFLVALVLIVVGSHFASKAQMDNGWDSFFDESDPAYNAYTVYQQDFGSDEVAYILYSVPNSEHGPFDLSAMERVAELTEALEFEVPFVKEVTSLTNVEFMTAEEDFLEIHELGLDMPGNQEEMLEKREAMMAKPAYRGAIVDDAALHGAIILEMTAASNDPQSTLRLDPEGGYGLENLYPQVSAKKIVELLNQPEYADIAFRTSGDVFMNSTYNELFDTETTLLTSLTFVLVSLIALICFRGQLLGLVAPLSVVLLALILTVAFIVIAGYKIGLLFLIAPVLLTAIGVAQSVHLITEFNLLRAHGMTRKAAVQKTLEHVAMPCLLAAVTTAISFLVMAGSNLRGLAEMAVYLGAGVLLTFIASITLMICFMSMGRDATKRTVDPSENRSTLLYRILDKVVAINMHHGAAILAIFSGIIVISAIGISKLHVGFNFLDEFKPHVDFRQHTEYVQEHMGGVLSFAIIYDAGEPDAIKSARILSHLAALQSASERSPLVEKSYSVADILKDINQSFHGDDPAYYRLPDSNELIAQYLLMYEISGGEELEDYVSGDYSRTTLELRVDMADSGPITELLEELEAYLAANPLEGVTVHITGVGMLFVKVATYIADSQVQGYTLAFIIIAIVLCIAFRSIPVGLLAMIPNLFPVIIGLGLVGWLGQHLDYFKMLLATVAIGIAVDDTVHTTSRLRKEFLQRGNYEEAVRVTLRSVGRALVITTTILTGSFLVYLVSELEILASFGTLLATTMVAALMADLFLLPALVLVLKPFGPEHGPLAVADADTTTEAAAPSR